MSMASLVSPINDTENLPTTEVKDRVEDDEAEEEISEYSKKDAEEDTRRQGQKEPENELICMPVEDPEGIDAEVELEAEVQRAATDPGQPSQAEREEHCLTHFPFRSWCRACVLGRARDAPSKKVRGLFAEAVLPRVRTDYCFLTENEVRESGEHGEVESRRSDTSVTVAVMQESLCRSVWAYAAKSQRCMEMWMV